MTILLGGVQYISKSLCIVSSLRDVKHVIISQSAVRVCQRSGAVFSSALIVCVFHLHSRLLITTAVSNVHFNFTLVSMIYVHTLILFLLLPVAYVDANRFHHSLR